MPIVISAARSIRKVEGFSAITRAKVKSLLSWPEESFTVTTTACRDFPSCFYSEIKNSVINLFSSPSAAAQNSQNNRWFRVSRVCSRKTIVAASFTSSECTKKKSSKNMNFSILRSMRHAWANFSQLDYFEKGTFESVDKPLKVSMTRDSSLPSLSLPLKSKTNPRRHAM